MPLHHSQKTRFQKVLLLFIILFGWMLLWFPPLPICTLLGDTEQYHAMSRSLSARLGSSLFSASEGPHFIAYESRPPLYPLLIAFAESLLPVSSPINIVCVHMLLGLITVGVSAVVLHRFLPSTIVAVCAVVALLANKQTAWADMSEWLSSCMCLLGFVFFLRWSFGHRHTSILVSGLFFSLATLTRASMFSLVPMFALATLTFRTTHGYRSVPFYILGLMPLLLWSVFSSTLQGSNLGSYEAINFITTSRGLGEIPLLASDPPEIVEVVKSVNQSGASASQPSLELELVHSWGGEFFRLYHQNFLVAYRALRGHSILGLREAIDLFVRTILQFPDRYMAFLASGGFLFLTNYGPIVLGILLASFLVIRLNPSLAPLAKSSSILAAIVVVYQFSILSMTLWLPRYYFPVQPAMVFALLVCCLTVVTFRHPKRLTSELTPPPVSKAD